MSLTTTSNGATAPPANDALAAIRLFNRFELKYLADRDLIHRFRAELPARMTRDQHGVDGMYPLWSTYYDSPDLRFYWEKIDGEKFRRKLRIRHYGGPADLSLETPVWIEIKQRVNKVTQKRRLRLPDRDALVLCEGNDPGNIAPDDRAVADEIMVLSIENRLRPTVVVGYIREAYLGRDEDSGLRVTIDSRVRGRDRDFDLRAEGENRLLIPANMSIVEIKVNERVPWWLTELVAKHNISLIRISKYCQCIERHGHAPRSQFHLPATIEDTLFVDEAERKVMLTR